MRLHRNAHIKPFMCEFCSHKFSTGIDLKKHRYTHTGTILLFFYAEKAHIVVDDMKCVFVHKKSPLKLPRRYVLFGI